MDAAEWTEMHIEDLKAFIEAGGLIDEIAEFLNRRDSVEAIVRKCQELGLTPKARS